MLNLVADIGGTNTRIALARKGGLLGETIVRFQNDEYDSFDDLLEAFLKRQSEGSIKACVIAVAGPVLGRTARLTNRDWTLRVKDLQEKTSSKDARIMNDLTALGYAIDGLGDDSLSALTPPAHGARANTQALVIGVGTGFNVCPVLQTATGRVCFQSETGHAGLPVAVKALLHPLIGGAATEFQTIESCFSGAGLQRIYHLATGAPFLSAGDIFASGDRFPEGIAGVFLNHYAKILGVLARSLIVTFLPLNGLYFSGGVARALLKGDFRKPFVEALSLPYALNPKLNKVPVSLITDDFAALNGCVAALGSHA